MSRALQVVPEASASSERRKHARQRLRTLVYAELDRENGGIVLDASEGGISVHAVVPLKDDFLPHVRLNLPEPTGPLETKARIVWKREEGKVAGLQFEDLSLEAQAQIKNWVASEKAVFEGIEGADPTPPVETPAGALPLAAISENRDQPAEPLSSSASAVPGRTSGHSRSTMPPAAAFNSSPVASKEQTLPTPAVLQRAATPNFLSGARRHAAFIYLGLIALAAISLGSGWAAGTGSFHLLIKKLRASIAPAGLNRPVAASESKPEPAPIAEIDILSANNQERTISLLRGSSESANPAPKPSASAEKIATTPAAPADKKPGMNFQIWTLTSPQASRASLSASRSSAPPKVEGYPSAPQISMVGSSAVDVTAPGGVTTPKVMTGVLKRGALIHRIDPEYPDIARQQHIFGTVALEATVGADGRVRDVRVISGSKLLMQSAVNAVRQWRYAPTLLDGKPVATQVEINVVFNPPSE